MKMEYVRHGSARLFEADWLESMSKVHPSWPVVLYAPVVLGTLGWSLFTRVSSPAVAAIFFALGWVTWCALEYGIHRYFFHWEGSGPITRKLHAIVHGYHHTYPDDSDRLVMPLGASIPLALVIGGILYFVHSPAQCAPLFAGIVAGYLFYDFTHWYVHARTPKTAWGRALRSHHMAHHFANNEVNFGISHRWIDALVGSLKSRSPQRDSGDDARSLHGT